MVSEKNKQIKPYERLAPFYDGLMEHVDYKQWARYIRALLQTYRRRVVDVADLACGTGSFLRHFKKKKLHLYGCDRAQNMVRLARQKANNSPFHWACCDFLHLPFGDNRFDAVLILYDSINYLLTREEVQALLSEVYRVLRPAGLFVFDAVLPFICREVFDGYNEVHFFDDEHGYERISWFDEEHHLQYNRFRLYDQKEIYEELHTQKIWRLDEWQKILAHTPFYLQAVHGDFTFRDVRDKTERVHFVLQKKEQPDF